MRLPRTLAALVCAALAAPAAAQAAAPPVRAADVDQHLRALADIAAANGGNRAAGLPGAEATAGYLAAQLRARGWQTRLQPVTFPFSLERSTPTLGALQHGRDFVTARGSASADVTGRTRAITAQRCTRRSFRAIRRGEIVLLPSSECSPTRASTYVRARGGVAIVYDGGTETYPLRPSLPGRITVPIFIARTSSVVELRRTRAPVRARADMVRERRTASNVIAELPGGPRIVMAGGHLDSVPEAPGVNDNGSGLAALLEVAGRLPSEPRRATVRLGFWTAEEYGLHGSRHYVAGLPRAERRRFAAYLNYDMVGSPNGLAEVYDSDDALEALQRRAFRGPVGETFLGGASDHQAFEQAGIPVNGVYTGALERRDGRLRDRCYHRACDGAANVNRDLAARVATAAERALAQLAAGGRGA